MDAAQIQALANAIAAAAAPNRGTRKTTAFSSTKGQEWKTWRHQFELVVNLNNWNDERARNELAAAMEGDACRAVEDIPVDADAAAHPEVATLLNLYEARFVTVADTDSARLEFRQANQARNEELVQWHSRLRELYRRAYPALGAAAVDASADLIDRFVMGLLSDEVGEYVLDRRPDTYTGALTIANTKVATIKAIASKKKKPMRGEPSVMALEANSQCYFCEQMGHYKISCPLLRRAREEFGLPPPSTYEQATPGAKGRYGAFGGRPGTTAAGRASRPAAANRAGGAAAGVRGRARDIRRPGTWTKAGKRASTPAGRPVGKARRRLLRRSIHHLDDGTTEEEELWEEVDAIGEEDEEEEDEDEGVNAFVEEESGEANPCEDAASPEGSYPTEN